MSEEKWRSVSGNLYLGLCVSHLTLAFTKWKKHTLSMTIGQRISPALDMEQLEPLHVCFHIVLQGFR
jgi:hypothetical protein